MRAKRTCDGALVGTEECHLVLPIHSRLEREEKERERRGRSVGTGARPFMSIILTINNLSSVGVFNIKARERKIKRERERARESKRVIEGRCTEILCALLCLILIWSSGEECYSKAEGGGD